MMDKNPCENKQREQFTSSALYEKKGSLYFMVEKKLQ